MSDTPRAADGPAESSRTVYLHVGLFKSGTSFLQSVLLRNQESLHRNGVLFPTGARRWGAQVRAVRDVLEIKHHNPSDGAWDELVVMIHGSPVRTAIVSMEFLSLADADAAQRIVADLAPWRVEVIITIRDLARVLPSAWQSMVKQGHDWPFAEFVEAVRGDPTEHDASRRFWHHHDATAIVDRWLGAVGSDRTHLVTVPPSGAPPSVLWERFSSVVGIDPDAYDITQDRNSNFSLSYSDTELLRQVNHALSTGISRKARKRYSTRYLSNRVLRNDSANATASDRPALDEATQVWAAERSRQIIAGLRSSGVRVVGDLDELQPVPGQTGAGSAPLQVYPERTAEIIAALIKKMAALDPTMPDGASDAEGVDEDPEDLVDTVDSDRARAGS